MKTNFKKIFLIIFLNIFFSLNSIYWYQTLIDNNNLNWHKVKIIKVTLNENTKIISSISTNWN